MSSVGATGDGQAVDAAVQQLLAQQLAKQLLSSAMPQDDPSTSGLAPYQDQFAEILAKAVTNGTGK
ncbi:MAG: hypothetical protein QOH43_3505 [Solirubrobacteraceae bacterium]|jgi:hypothetical protein|nr:hypothetical protein [Solirubrobacteraceae bacterium]